MRPSCINTTFFASHDSALLRRVRMGRFHPPICHSHTSTPYGAHILQKQAYQKKHINPVCFLPQQAFQATRQDAGRLQSVVRPAARPQPPPPLPYSLPGPSPHTREKKVARVPDETRQTPRQTLLPRQSESASFFFMTKLGCPCRVGGSSILL